MKNIKWDAILGVTIIILMVALFWYGVFHLSKEVIGAKAYEVGLGARVKWNTTNIQTSVHPRPTQWTVDDTGWTVYLDDSSVMRQVPLYEGLEKATLDDAVWYVCRGIDIIWGPNNAGALPIAENDLQAWSICLSK
jgi:hypothetical protein